MNSCIKFTLRRVRALQELNRPHNRTLLLFRIGVPTNFRRTFYSMESIEVYDRLIICHLLVNRSGGN